MTGDPTVVLVHGAACNSSSWGPVVRELALRGVRALAVDLPGHGFGARIPRGYLGAQDTAALASEPSGMRGVSTADDVAAVVEVLRRARAHGPTVLAGVSRGGLTLNAVGNAAPDLVDHLVYVSAHCPTTTSVAGYQSGPEAADSLLGEAMRLLVADPATIGAIRMNWRTADESVLDALQAALLADGTRDELLAYLHTQDPDETLGIDEDLIRGDPATWGRIPRSYVRLTVDRALPPALQDRYIADADALTPGNRFTVHELGASHVGVQVHPAPITELLARIALG